MAQNTDTYSLLSLMDGKVDFDAHTQVPVDAVVIPQIQRPYAQGRTDKHSTYVRHAFLDELFGCLCANKECDLNFVYGIVSAKGEEGKKEYTLELLDGQQRLTTLFLLYWYIACAELKDRPDEMARVRRLLGKFKYETRRTASLFCQRLVTFSFDNTNGMKPSECLRNVKWYFKSFDRDSTVCAMLNTLDDIHQRYTHLEAPRLFDALENVRFYVKSLGVFNLSEELYIKMNARGLQLTPFENFKADLTNFISNSKYPPFKDKVTLFKKGTDEKVEFDFNFSVKLDAKWVDLFWNKGSEEFDDSMMSFFSRFFSVRYIVESAGEVSEREMRFDPTIATLYTNAEANLGGEKYLGFKTFEEVLSAHPDDVVLIDKVLDVLYEHDLVDGQIYHRMVPVWDKASNACGDDFYRNSSAKNTHVKMIAFGAFIAFVDHMPSFDVDLFDKWMRVVWNIIENTNIDSLQPVTSLLRKFDSIASWIGRRMEDDNASFYEALASYRKSESSEKENRAVLEEVKKARRIAENTQWEAAFRHAENHPFFKGMVSFFYDPSMTVQEFDKAYANASLMFDANGITEEFRNDHILIRAIISRLSTWDEINEQYITERAETQKYLKNLLASNSAVQRVIVQAVRADGLEAMRQSLSSSIANAPAPQAWPGATDDQSWGFHHAIDLLRNNAKIYDWVAQREADNKKAFRVYWFNDHVMLAQPYMQFAKIALDTERARMAASLAGELDLQYDDPVQQVMYEAYRDVYGNESWLSKEVNGHTLKVGFIAHHKVRVTVIMPSPDAAQNFAQMFDGAKPIEEYPNIVEFPALRHWRYDRDYAPPAQLVRDIEQRL